MKDKLCVITGANCGVGLATARGIARTGVTVVVAARNSEDGQRAVEDIKRSTASSNVELLLFDLSSLDSIRTSARVLLERHERIDILINNAGLVSRVRRETKDGFEMTLGVNHLGHFLWTNLLLDRVKSTAAGHGGARIINVSSAAHRGSSGLDFEDLMYESRRYRSLPAYCDSKLANILFTKELARRLGDTEVVAHAVHPGLVRSRLGRAGNVGIFWSGVFSIVGLLAGVGARRGSETSVFVATSREAGASRGEYWEKSAIAAAKLPPNETAVSARLWAVSAELTGLASIE